MITISSIPLAPSLCFACLMCFCAFFDFLDLRLFVCRYSTCYLLFIPLTACIRLLLQLRFLLVSLLRVYDQPIIQPFVTLFGMFVYLGHSSISTDISKQGVKTLQV